MMTSSACLVTWISGARHPIVTCPSSPSLDNDDDWTTGYIYSGLPLGSDYANRCDWDTINYNWKVGPFGSAVTRDVCNPSTQLVR